MTANTEPNTKPISELLRMRRSAHQFLVGHAPVWFALQEDSAGPMLMPPSLPAAAGIEPIERLAALATDEATRLSHAELFTFDPGATVAAISCGARLQASGTMAAPVGSARIARHGIVPPAPVGFLRWATPITPGSDQMPITGVHWSRITTPEILGTWLVFWGDLSAMLVRGLADVSAPIWFTPQLANEVLAHYGSVYYDTSAFLQDPRVAQKPDATADPVSTPFTHLRALPLTTLPTDQIDPSDTLIYIVLAPWAMLTPDSAYHARPAHLARRTVPAPEAEADRRAGLSPARHVTLVTAPALRPTDPLPAGVSEDVHQLPMRIIALAYPDTPDDPSPEEMIANLLRRYETEVAMMAAYLASRHLLCELADKAHTIRVSVLTQILSQFSADGLPFDPQAWMALRHLLLTQHPEPMLPPPGIARADLLWALGTFQACALMRVTAIEHCSDRSNHTTATWSATLRRTRRSSKKRR